MNWLTVPGMGAMALGVETVAFVISGVHCDRSAGNVALTLASLMLPTRYNTDTKNGVLLLSLGPEPGGISQEKPVSVIAFRALILN